MARTLVEAKLGSRAERKRLVARPAPYWRGVDTDVHLGYRRGKRGGTWLVRWRDGPAYRQQSIGTADDELQEGTVDFDEAMRLARRIVEAERRRATAASGGSIVTVQAAVEAYMTARDERDSRRRGRNVSSDARSRLSRYVVGKPAAGGRCSIEASALALVPLHALEDHHLVAWREGLPASLSSSTVSRLINDLRAALNEAYATARRALPPTLPATIKHGLRASGPSDDARLLGSRQGMILADDQIRSLLDAAKAVDAEQDWEGDLFRMGAVLAATGARFSQIRRLRVEDVQSPASRLMMPASRKGKGGKAAFTPIPVGTDIIDLLQPIVLERAGDEILLERWLMTQVTGTIRWKRAGRGPWQTASEIARPWKALRGRADLPEITPYAPRHSSLVRCIRANLPIRLVAAMHDTSVQMIESHYSRYIVDGLEELATRAIVPLLERR